jgi:hypothetical protein
MEKVSRFLRQAWWLVVGLVAAVMGVGALLVFRASGKRPEATTWRPGQKTPKPLRERAREEVERVRLEGELEKARQKVLAQVQRAELRHIEQQAKEDPKGARRNLAAWLQRNL